MLRPTTLATLLALTVCTPSQEPVRVQIEVVLDGSGVTPSTSDLGWEVELTTARIAAADLQFSILGEMHDATAWVPGWILGRAWAHPGHYSGGDVTGELAGEFILDWRARDGMKLGDAELLVGDYNGINFTFRAAAASDGLAAEDPLIGHTAQFVGVARKDGVEVVFTAILDIDAGTQMVGAPFEDTIEAAAAAPIELQLLPTDPLAAKSLFDGLDFAALDELDMTSDDVASIAPGDEAHNILRRALQSHVHYNATPR